MTHFRLILTGFLSGLCTLAHSYPYQEGECLRSIYEGCLTYPPTADEMKPLPGREIRYTFAFEGGPEITPVEWVDITDGALNIYDYREDGWAECFGQVLTDYSIRYEGLTQFFRTPRGALGAHEGAIQLIGPEYHEPVHSNRRSYFMAHNHFRFKREWDAKLLADFMMDLVPCGVPENQVQEMISTLDDF